MQNHAKPVYKGDEEVPNCPTCGAGASFAVPVWEQPNAYATGQAPDYIGCTECHTMRTVGEGDR